MDSLSAGIDVQEAGSIGDMPVRGGPLRCEVVSDFGRLRELSSDWKRLWNSDSQAEIFQTPEWTNAWWRCFGQGTTLCSLVVFSEDEIVGIVPLGMRKGIIEFLGTREADYTDIICADEWTTEVLTIALETLFTSVRGWKECALRHLSKDSRVLRHYPELPRELRDRVHCLETTRYQTIILGDEGDAILDSLLRKHHTRRRQNKLKKAGCLRFRHLETRQTAEEYLTDFFRHHVRRHAVIGRKSSYAAPESCQFVRSLIEQLGPAERIRFG